MSTGTQQGVDWLLSLEGHSDVKFVYSARYEADIGTHVFPTAKYRLVREKLIREGLARQEDFVHPEMPSREELHTVHTTDFLDDLLGLRWTKRTMNSELPISRQIIDAYFLAAGGSILAGRTALGSMERVCVHLGGGFHHAFAGHAEGFCYVNDIAVAIRVLQRDGTIKTAMVADCDLHQGNGTAHIFRNDPDVFTFSIHQEKNYPMKEQSDVDVGLEDFAGDDEYLASLDAFLIPAMRERRPEFLVYVAGADPYAEDMLGALKLSLEGLRARDQLVLGEASRLGIPAIVVLAGGYARNLEDTVEIHTATCRVALKVAAQNLAG